MRLDRLLTSRLPKKTLPGTIDKKIALAFCTILIIIYILLYYNYIKSLDGLYEPNGTPIGGDFFVFWTAASAVLRGQPESIFVFAKFHALQEQLIGREPPTLPWGYPPHGLLLFLPLGLLPFVAGLLAWYATTLFFYCWATRVALAKDRFWLAILVAPSTYVNIHAGQNGFLTASLFLFGFTQLHSRPYIAGVFFGLLTLKPQLGVLIPFALLAGRHWKAIFSAVCTTVLLVAVSIAAFGADVWATYFTTAFSLQREILEHAEGIFMLRMPTIFMATRVLGFDAVVGYAVQAIVATSIALLIVLAYRRGGQERLKLSLVALGTFLVTPYAYGYDMTLASVAVLILLAHCVRDGFWPGERAVLALAWIVPLGVVILNLISLPLAPVLLLSCLVPVALRCFGDAREPAAARVSDDPKR